jgi:hypothetical protein
VNPNLPAGIDDGIAWLMRKDPAERPPNLVTAVRALEASAEASGFSIPKQTWDGATPTPHNLERPPTPPTRASKTPGAFAATAASGTPGAFAATVAHTSSVGPASPAPGRSRLRWLGGFAAVAVVAGGALVFLKTQNKDEAKPASAPPIVASAAAPPSDAMVALAQMPADAASVAVPEPPKQIAITVEHAPPGSEVLAGGKVLGTAPGPFMLDRGTDAVELTVRHAGYTPAKLSVVPDQPRTLEGTLAPIRKKTPPSSGGKPPPDTHSDPHGIEDPFTRK